MSKQEDSTKPEADEDEFDDWYACVRFRSCSSFSGVNGFVGISGISEFSVQAVVVIDPSFSDDIRL